MPLGEQDDLKVSYDGTSSSANLVTQFENNQCKVVGKYYCANNAWRSVIPGYEGDVPSELYVKSAPAGAELVQNGDFSVCNGYGCSG